MMQIQKAAAKRQVAQELKETILTTAARFGIISGKVWFSLLPFLFLLAPDLLLGDRLR